MADDRGSARRRRTRSARWAAAVGCLAAGCASVPGSATVEGTPWAQEAEAWIAAYDGSAGTWDGVGALRTHDFYAPDVLYNGTLLEAYGRRSVAKLDAEMALALGRHDFGEPYLDRTGLVRTESLVWNQWTSALPVATARAWEITPEGVTGMRGYTLVADTATQSYSFGEARIAAEALAAEYVRAWAESDHGALRDIYASSATIVDSLRGLEVTGREAIVALADPETARPARLALADELHADDALAQARPPGDLPAAYVTWSYLRARGTFRGAAGPAPNPAQVLLFERTAEACPGASAVVLTMDAGHVLMERRLHSLESVRACTAKEDLAHGWWTGLGMPLPVSERITGSIDSAEGPIEVRNGTPELNDLIRWGLDRFPAAGLPSPRVRSVTFDPYSPRCTEFDGYATSSAGATAILYCAEAGDIGVTGAEPDGTCPEPDCPNVNAHNRGLLLHELGHAWLATNTYRRERERFVGHVDVSSWDDPAVPPAERGLEIAASTLAWGLGGMPDVTGDLAPASCDSLAEGFRVLTGSAPLTSCE